MSPLRMPSVTAASVDGATNQAGQDPNGADGEVLLDIEVAAAASIRSAPPDKSALTEMPVPHPTTIARRGGMQSPVTRAVLENDEREYGSLSDVVVATLPHRNALVQFRAVEKRLAELSNVAFALQLDAELLSNGAGAPIASNQVRRSNGLARALARLDQRCYGIAILRE